MARYSRRSKPEYFSFRIDPALKAAFASAAKARNRTAAELLRDLVRDYLHPQHGEWSGAEARRQSLAIARRSRDTSTDEYASLRELEAMFEDAAPDEDRA